MGYRDEFKNLIDNIKISTTTATEEFESQVLPLIQFIGKNVPSQLYKFRGCTAYNLDAFEKDELWLSKASLYNDPHDSLLYFDKKAILENAQEQFSSDNTSKILHMLKEVPDPLEIFASLRPDIRQQVISNIQSIDDEKFFYNVQQTIHNLDSLLEQLFYLIKEDIRNRIKMFCLSESIKSPLMWAHYADNHKGFAIGYDFRNNDISQCTNCPNRSCNNIKLASIYPVIYSENRFDATKYGKWRVEQYMKSLLGIPADFNYDDYFLFTKASLYKSNDWAYENEWRIICSTPNKAIEQKDCYPIKKRPIAIYFGCQIPDIYRKMLMHIADEKNILRYQMYVKDYSSRYELDYMPI